MKLKKHIGAALKARRIELGLSQTAVANQLGWKQCNISVLEVSAGQTIGLRRAARLATVLKTDLRMYQD